MSVERPSSGQTPQRLLDSIRSFFVEHCEPPRNQLAAVGSSEAAQANRQLWTLEVDCMKLLAVCPALGHELFSDTKNLMQTLRTECAALCGEAGQTLRPNELSIRFTHLPTVGLPLPSLPPAEGQLVQVCGSIVRMTAKRVVPYASRLMCPRCHSTTEVFSDPFDRAALPAEQCAHTACKREALQVVGQVWMDYAECRLQQRSNQSGRLPKSVLITLDDELTTKATVGQFVEVVGMLFPRWSRLSPLSRPTIEPALWAVNVLAMEAYRGAAGLAGGAANQAPRRQSNRPSERPKFSPEHFYASFGKRSGPRNVALVSSVCPQLAGLFAPRMALLLSAVGGASTTGKASMHIRSTIHCLLVGDPSTGKSQLLRYAAMVAPRSTTTTGMGSTSAGLTVAATKENGEWVLEPGALVLSDGGTCVIDELRTVSAADRASLHEAMEQQTISVAKAGLVTKLRTACAVLSACNPPATRNGRTEIGVGGPLLSRFDFIFLLWDTPQPATDERIAEHVLSCNVARRQHEPPLTTEEVARYLWWVRSQYAQVDGPLLSDRAADLLGRYYEIQRQRGATPSLEDAVPVTVRLLESLVRIAQAHAKLHLQSVCTLDDAAMAIFLMERTAHSLKCPLTQLAPELYSSSRDLDAIFMSDSADCMEGQEAVLRTLVEVIEHVPMATTDFPDPPSQLGDSTRADPVAKGGAGLAAERGQRGDEAEATTLLSIRRRHLPSVPPFGRAPEAAAVEASISRWGRDISMPSCTPRGCVSYPADPPAHRVDAATLLNSQRQSTASRPRSTPEPKGNSENHELTPFNHLGTAATAMSVGSASGNPPGSRKRSAEDILFALRPRH